MTVHTRRHLSGRLLRWLAFALFFGLAAVQAAFWAYQSIGKTPGELFDYIERRLTGHPKLEWMVLPVIGKARDVLDAPSVAQRKEMPFLVQQLPKLTRQSKEGRINEGANWPGRVMQVGLGRAIPSIELAAKMARDGDLIEIDAGDYYGDVALWYQKRLTIRAVGGRARLHATGRSAESKAIWVIRNGEFDISNIEFVGAKVSDRNGAGIRFENGHLRIRNSLFWANENGILAGSEGKDSKTTIEIDDCEFGYNGNGDGLSHGIYVGSIEHLRISGSYFHHGNVGHLIKSRAKITELLYNRITDEAGGRSSYEVDISNGGEAILLGNIIQQTRETENSTMIAFGREGYVWPENRLVLASNTLINDHSHGGAFVWVGDGPVRIVSANNLLSGPGSYHSTVRITDWNDIRASWGDFERPSRYDYRLNERGRLKRYESPPGDIASFTTPERQFAVAKGIGSAPIKGKPNYPGALQ